MCSVVHFYCAVLFHSVLVLPGCLFPSPCVPVSPLLSIFFPFSFFFVPTIFFFLPCKEPTAVLDCSCFALVFIAVGTFCSFSIITFRSICMRFYPQPPSGQAMCVATDVFPSPPRYSPSFLSRIGFSIPTFQLFMLVDLNRFFRQLTLSRFRPVDS